MPSYRATVDAPTETVARTSRWIQAHRTRVDTRPWQQRAATSWTQTVLVLRWLIEGTHLALLARDARISQATAYRYLHEGIDLIRRPGTTCGTPANTTDTAGTSRA